ncbi:hypothetical protein MP228_003510 [Amoeboaphelidium protococcarum]|nr:hypothetical protein MP228_004363 [Amoeboaphelidium protococcarum]KAI3652207.1 hypothetical protein MP228_003510 [Amoeboaphelidium protococcarum]
MSLLYNNATVLNAGQEALYQQLNGADMVWVMVASVLVFIMTPANGYFYGGTVEFKNAMSVIFICMLTGAVVSIQWFFWGYSLAFSDTSTNGFIGDLYYGGFANLGMKPHPNCPTIPGLLFSIYQLMFATVTPALAFGSIAERTRILPWIVFLFVWCTFVYDIVAYWTWNPSGWLYKFGIKDFAGGIPVHIVSGVSGLALSLAVGKRSQSAAMPHNLTHTALGTALFWFGWFGFNGGSECRMDTRAINAAYVTHLSACFGGLAWILYDYRLHQKITSLGFCSGAVAGLVVITPAAGFVAPWATPIFGIAGALAGNNACFLKSRFEYDDSLDAFAVHAAVGFVGTMMTAIFATTSVENMSNTGSANPSGWIDGNFYQFVPQFVGCLVSATYVFVITLLIAKVMDKIRFTVGGRSYSLSLRMNREDELTGTDFSLMGEVAYDFTHTGQKHIEALMA